MGEKPTTMKSSLVTELMGLSWSERLSVARTTALATAERVSQRVLEEKERAAPLVGTLMEKLGTAVEEFADEAGLLQPQEPNLGGTGEKPLDLVYVTKQFVAMSFPRDRRRKTPQSPPKNANDAMAVAKHLTTYHRGRYMVLNVSEETYDYGIFEDQVLEFKFPGQPAPPLGMLFKMCASIESWLAADPENIVAAHCLTGRGRTSVVLACAATWLGLFESTFEALAYVAQRRGDPVDVLTIPSQRRYAQYFANVLDGVAPRSEPLVLRRAIMNVAPNFMGNGCRPYLQFFKAGKLAYTASWTRSQGDDDATARSEDGPLVFPVDCVVHGDLLVRCRHLGDDGGRISMFRAALHVGYAPAGVLRLAKSQLDGACTDDRFPNDFVLDLIFAPVQHQNEEETTEQKVATAKDDLKTSYDALLHKDSRFWEEVRARKDRARRYRDKLNKTPSQNADNVFAIGLDDAPRQVVGPPVVDDDDDEAKVHTEDLLQQLAEAEEGLSSTSAPPQQQVPPVDDTTAASSDAAEVPASGDDDDATTTTSPPDEPEDVVAGPPADPPLPAVTPEEPPEQQPPEEPVDFELELDSIALDSGDDHHDDDDDDDEAPETEEADDAFIEDFESYLNSLKPAPDTSTS